jgi:hypothetical protein
VVVGSATDDWVTVVGLVASNGELTTGTVLNHACILGSVLGKDVVGKGVVLFNNGVVDEESITLVFVTLLLGVNVSAYGVVDHVGMGVSVLAIVLFVLFCVAVVLVSTG